MEEEKDGAVHGMAAALGQGARARARTAGTGPHARGNECAMPRRGYVARGAPANPAPRQLRGTGGNVPAPRQLRRTLCFWVATTRWPATALPCRRGNDGEPRRSHT